MTNQDYMDLLETYSNSNNVFMKTEYNNNHNMSIDFYVCTGDHFKDKMNPYIQMADQLKVIIISDGKLYMPMPNIMDRFMEYNMTVPEYRSLIKMNEGLIKNLQNKLVNQQNAEYLYIPSYDEAESFQRELSGEIVLYESHKKYIHQIVKKGHDKYIKTFYETWDKDNIM